MARLDISNIPDMIDKMEEITFDVNDTIRTYKNKDMTRGQIKELKAITNEMKAIAKNLREIGSAVEDIAIDLGEM
tara:strand:+ start:43 stop:267 length:225 start_codon:yes stop_codon:yes gene_type:complete